jgi:hypothetical protein
MCLPQCGGAQCECVVAVLAVGECLEIGEERDGGVVLAWFPGGDQCVDT